MPRTKRERDSGFSLDDLPEGLSHRHCIHYSLCQSVRRIFITVPHSFLLMLERDEKTKLYERTSCEAWTNAKATVSPRGWS